MHTIKLNKRGDTIVEVLIAIAVISLVLSAGYVAANRSSTNIEVAQEHQIATTIAQTQLELLNNDTNLSSVPNSTNNTVIACYPPGSQTLSVVPVSTPGNPCVDYNSSIYNEEFTVGLSQLPSSGPTQALTTYQVDVNWPRLGGGNETDDVKLFFQTAGQQ